MSKEFSIALTGQQRTDLWMFLYPLKGAKPRDRDGLRNLDAVCEAFGIAEIQAMLDVEGAKLVVKDIATFTADVGSVDLKRLIEYLGTMPDGIDTALSLRLLKLSDMLSDAKEKRLRSVPGEGA